VSSFVFCIARRGGAASPLPDGVVRRIEAAAPADAPGHTLARHDQTLVAAGSAVDLCVTPEVTAVVLGWRVVVGGSAEGDPPTAAAGGGGAAAALVRRWADEGPAVLDRLERGFAAAVWEPGPGRLTLQIDTLGMEALFVRVTPQCLCVATEAAPLAALPPEPELDPEGLRDVVAMRFLAGRHTLWQGVRQIPPGERCIVHRDGTITTRPARRFRYREPDRDRSLGQAVDTLRGLLHDDLVALRDSGVGRVAVLLSGGVDSSILAALAQPVFPEARAFTFTIEGFENPELERARDVAGRIGMPLDVVPVTPADVRRRQPWIVDRLQEPPLHYNNAVLVRVLEEIRGWSTVVIGGEFANLFGEDFLASGRRWTQRFRLAGLVPSPLRPVVGGLLGRLPVAKLANQAGFFRLSPRDLMQEFLRIPVSDRARGCLPAPLSGDARPSRDVRERFWDPAAPLEDNLILWVFRCVAHPCLRRNTRFARALGLEYHYPLRHPRVVHFAASLSPELKFDRARGVGKPVLRELCAQLVGRDVAYWSKVGFATPEVEWLEGPLSGWIERIVSGTPQISQIVDTGCLATLDLHRDYQALWTLATLEGVLESVRGGTSAP
jgi:asparagine synthase (glutamine-hydrolysing)